MQCLADTWEMSKVVGVSLAECPLRQFGDGGMENPPNPPLRDGTESKELLLGQTRWNMEQPDPGNSLY